jgi:uncharacterized protein with von Willebrand factor type A (vWA) domain
LAGPRAGTTRDRLHRSSRRLIWLNPLLCFQDFDAKTQDTRTLRPLIDEFRPAQNRQN